MIFSQTVDLPDAVPPATPIRKGARLLSLLFAISAILMSSETTAVDSHCQRRQALTAADTYAQWDLAGGERGQVRESL